MHRTTTLPLFRVGITDFLCAADRFASTPRGPKPSALRPGDPRRDGASAGTGRAAQFGDDSIRGRLRGGLQIRLVGPRQMGGEALNAAGSSRGDKGTRGFLHKGGPAGRQPDLGEEKDGRPERRTVPRSPHAENRGAAAAGSSEGGGRRRRGLTS